MNLLQLWHCKFNRKSIPINLFKWMEFARERGGVLRDLSAHAAPCHWGAVRGLGASVTASV